MNIRGESKTFFKPLLPLDSASVTFLFPHSILRRHKFWVSH